MVVEVLKSADIVPVDHLEVRYLHDTHTLIFASHIVVILSNIDGFLLNDWPTWTGNSDNIDRVFGGVGIVLIECFEFGDVRDIGIPDEGYGLILFALLSA